MSDDMPEAIDESLLSPRYVEVEPGVRLHYVTLGEGPLVVLLHGFPEFWYAWRRQIKALADAGFRVVAPDQRGYNLSDKPEAVAAYGVARLVEDIAALIRACGEEKAFVVGHDWGAGVTWSFAMRHPEMCRKVVVLNGPHPARLLHEFRTSPIQLIRSWYMFFFQIPALPEAVGALDNYAFLLKPMREEPTNPRAFSPSDLKKYAEAYSQKGALTAMINWYRAMLRGKAVRVVKTDVEALVLWGEDDRHLDKDLAKPEPDLVPNGRVVYIPGATHWLQHDAPARVNEEVIAFFR
jgi:pimeloyl-ACP methyl ester carboxylesterase